MDHHESVYHAHKHAAMKSSKLVPFVQSLRVIWLIVQNLPIKW